MYAASSIVRLVTGRNRRAKDCFPTANDERLVTAAPFQLAAGYRVQSVDIDAPLERVGTGIRPGDAILLCAGWIQLVSEAPQQFYTSQPGLGLEAAIGLARRDVCLIGADNAAVEAMSWQSCAQRRPPAPDQGLRHRPAGMMKLEELARRGLRMPAGDRPASVPGRGGQPGGPGALCWLTLC